MALVSIQNASIVHAHFDGKGIVGLTVRVMREGEVVLATGYGSSNLERQTTVTPTTMFPIGSTME